MERSEIRDCHPAFRFAACERHHVFGGAQQRFAPQPVRDTIPAHFN
jgi:hypothetical protein